MRNIPRIWIAVLGLHLTLLFSVAEAVPFPTYPDIKAIGEQIQKGDVDGALKKIHVWLDEGQIPWALSHDLMPRLIDAGYNKEVADMALDAIFFRPGELVPNLMERRTEALLNLNKTDEALQTAKGYYNVCPLKETPNAIDLICTCLQKAHPDDKGIVDRFKNEQVMAGQDSSDKSNPTVASESVLKSIKIPDSLYGQRLNTWIWTRKDQFEKQAFHANLLLIADQSEAAEKEYEALYKSAGTAKQLEIATDGVARSLRAVDGNVARMNTWLTSLQKSKPSAK